ncbi:MAG TPA: glutaredoxin family protein [Methylibium sp.]|nr:glutaredoxin family protein [Methylibium sp.]
MSRRRVALLLILLAALPAAQAQYKVIESDGRVTYTDRPTTAPSARVQSMDLRSGQAVTTTALPYALQQPAARFPVTLYTMPNCSVCDRGRAYLQQRGIPYDEKTIDSQRDRAAWTSLNLGSEVPVLRIGQQVLRNFAEAQWASDLDLAGYPAASQLPPGYRGWQPSPLAGAEPPPPPPRAQAPAALPPVLQGAPDGIRF